MIAKFLLLLTLPVFVSNLHAGSKLLPFQGYLTTSSGLVVPDGAKVVQFKIYDAPVSGNAVWAGEVHKLSVNKGLVNTILGTKTAFPERYDGNAKVMFSEPLYVEITVDADSSGTITAVDPPLLPRQVLLPANFAHVAQSAETVEGHDMVDGNGKLNPARIGDSSVPGSALTGASVTADKIAVDSIAAGQIASGGVANAELADDSVTTGKILDGEVMSEDLGNGQVTSAKIADGTIVGADVSLESLQPNRLKRDFALLWDQRDNFSESGGASLTGVQTRVLNRESIVGTSISKNGNQFTLKAGTYYIEARAPAFYANRHQIHLFNISSDAVEAAGSNATCFNGSGGSNQNDSFLRSVVTVEGDEIFELRHYIRAGYSIGGYGLGVSMGSSGSAPANIPGVYTQVYIERIK